MLESWLDRQNSPEALVARAASDEYWKIVQQLRAAEWVAFVLVPAVMAVVAQFSNGFATIAAVAGFLLSIIDAAAVYPAISRARRRAAQAQDRFDSIALSLPAARVRQTAGPDAADLRAAAARQKPDRAAHNRDWYTPALGSLPCEVGRVACMLETAAWDGGLRLRYGWLVGLGALACIAAFVIFAVISQLTMEQTVVRILFPLTPLLLWAGREFWDNFEASQSITRIRESLDTLWHEVIDGRVIPDSLTAQTIEFESAIFTYRKATVPVPDSLYSMLRTQNERTMSETTDDLIREYKERSSGTAAGSRTRKPADGLGLMTGNSELDR